MRVYWDKDVYRDYYDFEEAVDEIGEWDGNAYIEVVTDLSVRELLTTNRYPISERLAALRSKLAFCWHRTWWHPRMSWMREPLRNLYYRVTGNTDPYEIPF